MLYLRGGGGMYCTVTGTVLYSVWRICSMNATVTVLVSTSTVNKEYVTARMAAAAICTGAC